MVLAAGRAGHPNPNPNTVALSRSRSRSRSLTLTLSLSLTPSLSLTLALTLTLSLTLSLALTSVRAWTCCCSRCTPDSSRSDGGATDPASAQTSATSTAMWENKALTGQL